MSLVAMAVITEVVNANDDWWHPELSNVFRERSQPNNAFQETSRQVQARAAQAPCRDVSCSGGNDVDDDGGGGGCDDDDDNVFDVNYDKKIMKMITNVKFIGSISRHFAEFYHSPLLS